MTVLDQVRALRKRGSPLYAVIAVDECEALVEAVEGEECVYEDFATAEPPCLEVPEREPCRRCGILARIAEALRQAQDAALEGRA